MTDIIMKAAEFDKQSSKWRKGKTLRDLASTHFFQPKYDGCHLIVDTGSKALAPHAFSRTNEWVRSVEHIEQELLRIAGAGWVFQGEAWVPGWKFPQISGAYRRHLPQTELRMVLYDMHRRDDFHDGVDPTPYRERFAALAALYSGSQTHSLMLADRYPADVIVDPVAEARKLVAKGGYDGLMAADPEAGWTVGRSKAGELVKIKPTLSLDLMVDAVIRDVGDKTGRDVWTLVVSYRGVTSKVGSGVPHNEAAVPSPGQIVEVEAMGLTADGALREPRFKTIKYDKTEPDA